MGMWQTSNALVLQTSLWGGGNLHLQWVQQFPKNKKYVLIEGKQQIAKYLNYAIKKYGNDLTVLYEKQDLRGADESKFH